MRSCTIFMCEFIVTIVIASVMVEIACMKFRNCPPWVHGRRYTSSTRERRGSLVAGENLDSCYWGPPGEVENVWLLLTPENDASGMGVRSRITLGGGALEVDLSSGWSDSVNCEWSRRVRCDENSWLLWKLQKEDLVAWTRVSILLSVNFW